MVERRASSNQKAIDHITILEQLPKELLACINLCKKIIHSWLDCASCWTKVVCNLCLLTMLFPSWSSNASKLHKMLLAILAESISQNTENLTEHRKSERHGRDIAIVLNYMKGLTWQRHVIWLWVTSSNLDDAVTQCSASSYVGGNR